MIDSFDFGKHQDLCPSCGSNYLDFKCSKNEWKNKDCNCFEQNKKWRDYTISGIPNSYFSKNINDYHLIRDSGGKKYFEDIKKYIKYIDQVYKSGSCLYIYNQLTSTGKTFFAVSILKEAYYRKYSIQFLSLLKIQNELFSNKDVEKFLKKANEKDFLVIDSIDREIKKDFLIDIKLLNYFEQFLKERNKPIIFTSSSSLSSDNQIVKIIKNSLKDRIYEVYIDTPVQYLDHQNYWNNIENYKGEYIK